MLNFYKDTKIYVHCPAGMVTGGAELLHQLVHYLRAHGRDAYIIYFGDEAHVKPSDYDVYDVALTEAVEDNDHNIEVFYEGIFDVVMRYQHTQKFLWWISVDNFFTCAQSYLHPRDLYKHDKQMGRHWQWKWMKRCIKYRKNCFKDLLSIRQLVALDAECGYQAEYIQHFLVDSGFKEMLPLKDYINTDHCGSYDTKKKEDIILYNPRKGYEFTKQLIAMAPDLKWVPLQGFSRAQLVEVMQKAKLYIDFGNRPGKDRLPRECVMNGCCVITGMRGSAGFFEDVPIMNAYKFDERTARKEDIISRIRFVLNHYEEADRDFAFYHTRIMGEKEEFENQIRQVFQIKQ